MSVSFSIITPTLNAATFLPACLESVRSQSCPGLEHLVVDGGSRDATLELVRAAPGVTVLEQPRSNQVQAINAGVSATNGDVLAWLNADDEYTPGALRRVADEFEADAATDVLYGDCDVVDDVDNLLWRLSPGPYDFRRLLRRGNYIAQPAVFIHRRVFERVGMLDESFEFAMDYEFWLRLRNCRVRYVPSVLARFRWYSTSKTARNQFANWGEVLRAARRHGGGWTPELAWSFARMVVTVARVGVLRRLNTNATREPLSRSATLD